MHLLAAQAGQIQQDGEADRLAPKGGNRLSDKARRKQTTAEDQG